MLLIFYKMFFLNGQTQKKKTKKNHKNKKNVFYQTDRQTDRQTHVQLKHIIRNLTIKKTLFLKFG